MFFIGISKTNENIIFGQNNPSEKYIRLSASNVTLSSPADISYLLGDPRPYIINWTVTGLTPSTSGTYNISKNGAFYESGNWTHIDYITVDVSGINTTVTDTYICTVVVISTILFEHTIDESQSDTVVVKTEACIDFQGFVISGGNLVFEEGTQDNNIFWTVSQRTFGYGNVEDSDGNELFNLAIDSNVLWDNGNEHTGTVTCNVDFCTEIEHIFTCNVYFTDCAGNLGDGPPVSTQITVTVTPLSITPEFRESNLIFIIITIIGLTSLTYISKRRRRF